MCASSEVSWLGGEGSEGGKGGEPPLPSPLPRGEREARSCLLNPASFERAGKEFRDRSHRLDHYSLPPRSKINSPLPSRERAGERGLTPSLLHPFTSFTSFTSLRS